MSLSLYCGGKERLSVMPMFMRFMLVQPTIGRWRPVSMSTEKRESPEWAECSIRSLKKFARKWGF